MTDLPAYSGPGGDTMSLLHMLDELDRMQRLLEEEFPECKIGYAYRPGHVIWSAQIGPVLNANSPDALRAAIMRAYAEVLGKISGRPQDASSPDSGRGGCQCG
jgi:hypothetical protein